MTITTKQILSGLGAAGGLVAASVTGAPLWFAVAIGVGIFGAAQLLLPPDKTTGELIYPEGITEEELHKVISGIEDRVLLFQGVAAKVKPDFGAAIRELCEVIEEINRNFRKEPKNIRHPDVASLPPILDMLKNSLQGYVELAQRKTLTKEEEQSLDRIEKVVNLTIPAIRRLLSSLTNEDRRAMDVDAMTLEALLAGAADDFKESEVTNTRHTISNLGAQDSSGSRGGRGTK